MVIMKNYARTTKSFALKSTQLILFCTSNVKFPVYIHIKQTHGFHKYFMHTSQSSSMRNVNLQWLNEL